MEGVPDIVKKDLKKFIDDYANEQRVIMMITKNNWYKF